MRHFSYPRPSCDTITDIVALENMIETEVYTIEENSSPGPGPMALIQFRIWESGRLDFEKLTGILH